MAERANGILLDTSVVIAHLRGSVDLQTLASPDEPLFLPLVALGELYRGVLKSARPESNRAKVDEFLEIAAVLYPDLIPAQRCDISEPLPSVQAKKDHAFPLQVGNVQNGAKFVQDERPLYCQCGFALCSFTKPSCVNRFEASPRVESQAHGRNVPTLSET